MNKEELEELKNRVASIADDARMSAAQAEDAAHDLEEIVDELRAKVAAAPLDVKTKILEALRAEENRLAMGYVPVIVSAAGLVDRVALLEGIRNAIFIVENLS